MVNPCPWPKKPLVSNNPRPNPKPVQLKTQICPPGTGADTKTMGPPQKEFRWTVRGRTWCSPACSVRISSILLVAPLSKCQHAGYPNSLQEGPNMQVSHVDKNMVKQSRTAP